MWGFVLFVCFLCCFVLFVGFWGLLTCVWTWGEGWLGIRGLGLGPMDFSKGDSCRHLEGDSGREGRDLLVNVGFEGVGLPTPHLLDGEDVASREVHCHCSSGAEGVAADVRGFVAMSVEMDGFGGSFDGGVDVVRGDLGPLR